MCSTPYCDGSCEECSEEEKYKENILESTKECPYRKECNWETLDIKTDVCKTCGKITSY